MNAIPTTYAGVNFRSRLEAKWAAMFDLCGWRWQYEPLDLKGYIPDFILEFHEPLLVEVKPVSAPVEFPQYQDKIEQSGWDKEAIIVGSGLFITQHCDPTEHVVFGWLGQKLDIANEHGLGWDEGVSCGCCGIGIAHSIHSYNCRKCGHNDGNILPSNVVLIEANWREAGNRVQWMAK